MQRAAFLAIVLTAGCLRSAAYQCAGDLECVQSSVQGRCESVGYCSFPDTACSSGHRFGEVSGSYANQCVGANHDGGVIDGNPSDGAIIDGLGCPAGYTPVSGVPDRLYRRLPTAAAWMNQVTACSGEGANIYLAIPDDAAELSAIITVAASNVWIGISDTSVEGAFVTLLGGTAFLPWAPGEPDNSSNQDCVEASTALELATLTCSTQRIAVCECEP